jgi:hypothetical protein
VKLTLNDIATMFDRALSHTFVKKKLLLAFLVLSLVGLIVLFFHGLAVNAGEWVQLSLVFIPVFIGTGILMALGVLLIRIYHHEIKKRTFHYREMITRSWTIIMGASYMAVPLIVVYLVLWLLLGLFILLGDTSGLGSFFKVVLSFVPFLINLATFMLCLISLQLLYIGIPIIALRGLDYKIIIPIAIMRMTKNCFFNVFLSIISLTPLLFTLFFLVLATSITGSLYSLNQPSLQNVLSWFFIMIPFTAVLTPPLIFFFQFATEAHVWIHKSPLSEFPE